MKKRKATILISGQPCSFYSDDSDEYLSALEQRANAVMKETAGFSGHSAYTNAVLSVIFQTDMLLRAEQKMREMAASRKAASPGTHTSAKSAEKVREETGQVSVWELLDYAEPSRPD